MKVEAGGIARHSCATSMQLLIIPLAFCNHCKAAHTEHSEHAEHSKHAQHSEHAKHAAQCSWKEQAAQCNVHVHLLEYSTVYASLVQYKH